MKGFYIFVIICLSVGKDNMGLLSNFFQLSWASVKSMEAKGILSATVEPIKWPAFVDLKVQ